MYIFEYPQGYDKRLLAMGFQGMRGKKDEFPTDWEKRAPMGFQGMRGKKTLLDEIEELEKRAIMGFQVSHSINSEEALHDRQILYKEKWKKTEKKRKLHQVSLLI